MAGANRRPGMPSARPDRNGLGLPEPQVIRVGVPVVAVGVAVLAQVSDPGPAYGVALVGLAVLVLTAWAVWPRLPLVVLVVGVLVPVVLAVRTGQLEPALFLASVLALVVAWFEPSTVRAVAAGAAAAAAPLVAALLVCACDQFSWWTWVLGIVFPWLLGRLVRRQLDLIGRLEAAREELAAQVVTEERRRIARDVHDLVGHGLAAVLLQITGARHVLRRDVDAAEEALAAAEEAGRRSMAELRRTMALLRSDDDSPLAAPSAGIDGVGRLVRDAREHGLEVAYEASGDAGRVEEGVALAVHRIAQESLANAVRHAPEARTAVSLCVGREDVAMEVTSTGRLVPRTDDDRPRYGLVGMRERAEAIGGELWAGATSDGWQVRCRLPLNGPA